MSFFQFLFKLPALAGKIEKICNWVLDDIEADRQRQFLQKLKTATEVSKRDKDTSKIDQFF